MKWTSEDIKLVEKFIDIRNRGYYCDGGQLTEVYNRVLERHVPSTNCGSCMRARIGELEAALSKFKSMLEKASEPSKEVEVEDSPQEETKVVRKAQKKK